MKTRPLAFLACRVLAIYFLVRALLYSSSLVFTLIPFITQYQPSGGLPTALAVVSQPLLMFVASIVLWVGAEGLSGRMVGGIEEEKTGIQLDYTELNIAAFSVVGLVILTTAIPDIFAELPTLITQNFNLSGTSFAKVQTSLWVAEKLIRIMLSSYLLLGSRGVVRFVSQIRTVGLERIEQGEEQL